MNEIEQTQVANESRQWIEKMIEEKIRRHVIQFASEDRAKAAMVHHPRIAYVRDKTRLVYVLVK